MHTTTVEHERLNQHHKRKGNWRLWGPYLSDRAWGTVREDYSVEGEDPWGFFPHDHARSRTYRWNEDGLGGISDRNQYLCFAYSFWNGQDPILKERYFGLSNPEGNHGEDVKEYYFHLDNTPTHSYMKMLYKYPQAEFPYSLLVQENKKRNLNDPEYELLDTGIFKDQRYFDIFIEYAKAAEDDILIKLEIHNRGDLPAFLAVLPTLWFRNTWSWGYPAGPMNDVSRLPLISKTELGLEADHPATGKYTLYAEDAKEMLFTNNETNRERIFNLKNTTPYVKDAFHRFLIQGEKEALNPNQAGSKAAFLYEKILKPKEVWTLRLRLSKNQATSPPVSMFNDFDFIFKKRKEEADAFYISLQNPKTSPKENLLQREALAGMLWTKQLYYYDVEQWRYGDPVFPTRREKPAARNAEWDTLVNFDIISMPDKWEYPWYASWDLAFHCVSLVLVDPDFAKRQLTLIAREWYMHPNGQIPAYEWNFSNSNPPVMAWAAWRVYKIDAHMNGELDQEFLSGIFHKLLINFTWWINRKDLSGHNIFEGGFLGLDNISLFDRNEPLPSGGSIYQSDATAWMAFYCIVMMKIAVELGRDRPVYENLATKFFEHFLRIGAAMINCGGKGYSLWDPEDGFFYDVVSLSDGSITHLKVRSMVGLLPLLAVETASQAFFDANPLFATRTDWFLKKHPNFKNNIASLESNGDHRLLAILSKDRLISILRYMLDENEFLSEYGIRSLSKYHEEHPYSLIIDGKEHTIGYEPNVARSHLFGGNSNWRGPVWMPLNFLIIESLQKFYYFYQDTLKVECPTGSGCWMTLWEVSTELSRRLIKLFLANDDGQVPSFGEEEVFRRDPNWQNMPLFYEFFDGDTGAGLGASLQTGWTGLIAKLIQQSGRPDKRTWREDTKDFKIKERSNKPRT
ncbi:MAG: glucosidase [Parachlamydiaceae bacterium]